MYVKATESVSLSCDRFKTCTWPWPYQWARDWTGLYLVSITLEAAQIILYSTDFSEEKKLFRLYNHNKPTLFNNVDENGELEVSSFLLNFA